MADLFRFMVLRAPDQVDPGDTILIDPSSQSKLRSGLRAAARSAAPQAAMNDVALEFIASDNAFVRSPNSLSHGATLLAVTDVFENPARRRSGSEKLSKLIHSLFPKLAHTVKENSFLDDKSRIQDSIVALQLTPTPQSPSIASLIKLSQAVNLVERVAGGDSSVDEPGALANAASRIVVLPSDIFPVASQLVRQDPQPSQAAADERAAAVQGRADLEKRVADLNETILAVHNILAVNSLPPEANYAPPGPSVAIHAESAVLKRVSNAAPAAKPFASLAAAASMQPLSPVVQSVLSGLNLDLTTTPLSFVSERLSSELSKTVNLFGPAGIGLPPPDPFHDVSAPLEWWNFPPNVLPGPPTSHGTVLPAGIADLLVVREHVLRYESGEIAFVENIAKGETFKRQTQRKNTTENSTLTTTISGSQTERDLQSSDRFSLQTQSQKTIDENTALVPGVGSSDAYGPLVDAGGSTQQSLSQATAYAQTVTSRAVSKVAQSTQTEVLQRTTSEFDENVEHNFDNSKTGASDQIVVYQWLDKIVQAKVFSYGKRTLYDFVVPEPAVFIAYSMRKWQPELAALKKPTLFPLQPADLSTDPKNANYYQYWATGYGASSVQPPPEPKIIIARAYGDKGSDPQGGSGTLLFTGITAKEPIDIQLGYQAVSAVVDVQWGGGAPNTWVSVIIGSQYFQFDQNTAPNSSSLPLSLEVSQIPVSIITWNIGVYTVNLEITCTPTAQSIAQWQTRAHDAILQASRDRLAEYEDQFNRLSAALQVKAAASSAEEKRTLIKAELEKSCITILSNQHFDALGDIEYSPWGPDAIPQLFLPNVDPVGRYIRFFEQAFEWDQMLYRYYPYFWGRKKYWNDRLQLDDADPDFAAFLRAGAARITLPVRKGYEVAVATFMTSGQIPTEGESLSVAAGLYVPFFVEMMGTEGGPDTAVPYGDPPLEWEVRVPTNLVKIRTTSTLPRWKQNVDAQGRVTYEALPGDSVTP